MAGKNWFAVISSFNFGDKMLVKFLTAKNIERIWDGPKLIPANTACAVCGKDWHLRSSKTRPLDEETRLWRIRHLMTGRCYHCNSPDQRKLIESPVNSKGYFKGKKMQSLHFRLASQRSGFITTVCVDSLLADPKLSAK